MRKIENHLREITLADCMREGKLPDLSASGASIHGAEMAAQ
jgi:hypothetical protein